MPRLMAMHTGSDVPDLVGRVEAATEIFVTHATSCGIQLAFGSDKIAAILP